MSKKRTIDQYRQTKEFYKHPDSHKDALDNKQIHKFTNNELTNLLEDFLIELNFIEESRPTLLLEIKQFVSRSK